LVMQHLAKAEEFIVPVDYVKFLIWGCTQENDFYSQTGWQSLIRTGLNLSEVQIRKLTQMRESMQQLRKGSNDAQSRLKQLSLDVKEQLNDRDKAVQDLLSMLSPVQVAKLCVWLDAHSQEMKLAEPSSSTRSISSFIASCTPTSLRSTLPTAETSLVATTDDDAMALYSPLILDKSPQFLNTSNSPFSCSPFSWPISVTPGDTSDHDLFAS